MAGDFFNQIDLSLHVQPVTRQTNLPSFTGLPNYGETQAAQNSFDLRGRYFRPHEPCDTRLAKKHRLALKGPWITINHALQDLSSCELTNQARGAIDC